MHVAYSFSCALLALTASFQVSTREPRARTDEPLEGPGAVLSQRKISSEVGGFLDTLDPFDGFGSAVAALGDLDGDGIEDLAVGAPDDEDGTAFEETGLDVGAVWVLFLAADGTVRSHQKIDRTLGGFTAELAPHTGFGAALAPLGDLDGDGITELAVGAPNDRDGGSESDGRGAVWILFLARDGTVRTQRKISATQGGFSGLLDSRDRFGSALAPLGDLDGDGVTELAVGAPLDDDGGTAANGDGGAVWILFLAPDGSVRAHQKLSATAGGLTGLLDRGEHFGASVAGLGDLDGDGVVDLGVGVPWDGDGGGISRGAVWMLFLRSDGSVRARQKISQTQGGLGALLEQTGYFGAALARLGDLDGDGVTELGVGVPGDDDGGFDFGAVFVLSLNRNGTVRAHQEISATRGGFGGTLALYGGFGSALAAVGDLDGDGLLELATGAQQSDGGALWMLSLQPDGSVRAHKKIDADEGGFTSTLDRLDAFGSALVALGDLDGDGLSDFAAGAPADDDAFFNSGAVWVLFSRPDGSIRETQKISLRQGGFLGTPDSRHQWEVFGTALAALGDLDGDGVPDLAVGAPTPNYSAEEWGRGRVWILFLNPDGTVKAEREIGQGAGGFTGTLEYGDFFGQALATLGDLDGDGVTELAVGQPGNASSIWILFLRSDGSVRAERRLPALDSHFNPGGSSLAALGDLDRDGVNDLAFGALGYGANSVSVLFLQRDGSVRTRQEISATEGGFSGQFDSDDYFASSLAALGDLDGDGVTELAVGAPYDGDGGGGPYSGRGAVWILFLNPDGTVRGHRKISATRGGFAGRLDLRDAFGGALAALGDLDGDGLVELGVGAPGDDDGGYGHGALWLLALDGIARIDFEHGDDYARTALVNGQALATRDAFGRTFALTSLGPNLGATVFDSTPGGPNDPGPDPDLLVDLGNVLVLQDSLAPAQTVPGVFDSPGDDPDGGLLLFTFARAVELHSLVLVDIDFERQQLAKLTLFDRAGRARTYVVPAGWTGDRVTHGVPGFGTLDLTTLAPQPGFRSTATAGETPGFDARSVVRLAVGLGTSGALDELRFDPHPERTRR
jgi:hypothetical protein